jgi:multiple antibiotic resistance protein
LLRPAKREQIKVSQKIIYDALMIWVTIEPIRTVLLFTALTAGMTSPERRKVAIKATSYSALVLLGAIIIGQIILGAMNIQLISLQVAGGVVLFLFGLQMIFGQASNLSAGEEAGHDVAVFPLAVPSIVGPESITAVVLITDNQIFSIPEQAITAAVMFGVRRYHLRIDAACWTHSSHHREEWRNTTGACNGYDARCTFGRVSDECSGHSPPGGPRKLTIETPFGTKIESGNRS